MIKLKDLLREVNIGDTYVSMDGKHIELIVKPFMKGKWNTGDFTITQQRYGSRGVPGFVNAVGTSPEKLLGMYGKRKKLNAKHRQAIRDILQDPESVDMLKKDGLDAKKVFKMI